jgi:outer membrane receptor protein involved in Fe transport
MARKAPLKFVLIAASALSAMVPVGAWAQTALEEVVVTAQKRSENLQDVPITISAFTASALQERAVGNVAQLSNLAPNVTLDGGTPFSGSPSVLSAFVRGIGSDDFAFNIDPGVGIYVDGVYLARTVGANQDLLDVERIEILKGPQGTLFGRNTIGGAISIVTREPDDQFKFTGDVTVGSFNLLQARGSADVPLAEGLSSSITFGIKSRDGVVKRIPFADPRARNSTSYTAFPASGYDTASREGGENSWNLRGKLKWNGESTKVVVTGDYTHENSAGLANTLLATTEFVPGNFAGTTNLPGTAFDPTGTTGFLFAGLYNFCIGSTPTQIAARNAQALCGVRGTQFSSALRVPAFAGVNVDGNPNNDVLPFDSRFVSGDRDRSYATGNSFSRMNNWGVAATVEQKLTDDITVKSISGYRDLSWRSGMDADGSPLNVLQLSFDMQQWQVSEEVQVLGAALDDKLHYVLGGYYFKEKGSLHDYVTFDEGLLQVDGPNDLKTENYAAFGQVDWRVSDLIGVTIGARYTKEKKDFEGGQQDLNGLNYKLFGCSDANGNITPGGPFPLAPVPCQVALGYPNPANPVQVYVPGVNHKSFSNFSPKVGVQLHPSDNVMVFGSWSKGYKTGGWTTRLTNPQPIAPDFDEEKATTWEAGFKTRLFDRRLQLNGAVFTTDYNGIQLNFQQGTSPTIRNAGNARIDGAELEAVATPLEGLTLNASVGWLDARYTSVLPGVLAVSGPNPFQAGTFKGAPLPKTPDWKINFSPRYEFTVAGGGQVTLLGDWTYVSSIWNDSQRSFVLKRPGVHLLNASATYEEPNGAWSVAVGGTNLGNERYTTTGGVNVAAGLAFGTYSRPREGYVRFGMKF